MRALRHRSTLAALFRLLAAVLNAAVGLALFYVLWRDAVGPAITHFPERPVGLLLSPQVLLDISLLIPWLVACDALLRDSRRRHPWSSSISRTGSSTSTRTTSPRGQAR